MKLRILGFTQDIIFNEESVNVLKIDNANLFCNVIKNINDKANEILLLDENEQILDIESNTYIIFDIFNIEYNSKKILNKIYDIIAQKISLNQDFELERLSSKMRKYLTEEINEMPFEFTMKEELEVQDILKLFNLKIDEMNYNTILEGLEFLVNSLSALNIANILIIPNLKLYLNHSELVEFYKYALYNNINLLIIERSIEEPRLQYENIYIIDNEFDDFKQ